MVQPQRNDESHLVYRTRWKKFTNQQDELRVISVGGKGKGTWSGNLNHAAVPNEKADMLASSSNLRELNNV
jgi:hypothetical protein